MKENKFFRTLRVSWAWIYRLRSVILAIPVAAAAIILAIRNATQLPDLVEMGTAGTEAGNLVFRSITLSRNTAVLIPLIITAVCVLLMFFSKKVVYPWLVSLFSLVLPIALLLINGVS